MSHFTVLVISKSPEEIGDLLSPYHEFECTGRNDQYIQDIDITEETLTSYKNEEPSLLEHVQDYYGYKPVKFGESPNIEGDHKYGYILLNEHGEVEKVIRRTNPNSKWDWYVIGGRWGGMLQPGEVDQIRRDELDLVSMLEEAQKRKRDNWETSLKKYGGSIEDFNKDRARYDELVSELKKQATRETPLYSVIDQHPEASELRSKIGGVDYFYGINNNTKTVEEHIATAVPFSTHAVLTADGEWYESGEMGWWGVVFDEKDEDVWEREFYKMLNNVPGDYWLTIVDCHI